MTRSTSTWLSLPLLLLAFGTPLLLAPQRAYADDDDGGDEDEDEWSSTHLNLRLGIYYRPEMLMRFQVNGDFGTGTVIGTDLDLQRDLEVEENAKSDYMFENGILEGEISFDTRFISVGLWGILPYYYEGETVRTVAFNFAGQTFAANTTIESTFKQWHAGLDIKVNIIDNQFIRLSPVAAVRLLSIDWRIRPSGGVGGGGGGVMFGVSAGELGTSRLGGLLQVGDDQLLPYVELGGEIRVGYRHYIEGDLRLTGLVLDYDKYKATTIMFDVGVTGYLPVKIVDVGLRLGYRFAEYDFESGERQTNEDYFDFDLQYSGFNFSIVARF